MADVVFSGLARASGSSGNADVFLAPSGRTVFEAGEAKLAGLGNTTFANQGPDTSFGYGLKLNSAEVYRFKNS
jgi:hypothetical protein